MISVVIPTIAGRETLLADCRRAYQDTLQGVDSEIIVVEDRPTCGEAWVHGADQAQGDHIHFSADDLVPHPGWWQAAVSVTDLGFLPAPRILNTDGSIQSCGGSDSWETEGRTGEATDFSRIPFLARQQWDLIRDLVVGLLPHIHYYTDNLLSAAGRIRGVRTGIHRDYLFTHSLAASGRGAGMTWQQRMLADEQRFREWLQMI